MNSWPDGGMTPFRNEKNSNWEGAYRVPAVVRWPGHIPAGTVLNGIVSHHDWFVTLLSAVGVPDIAEKLRAGTELGGKTYKVHLDGHDQLPFIIGETDESPRQHFFYVSDDCDLTALRFDNWKIVFLEQRCPGTLQIWAEPFTELRVPKIFNLRTDPYERADITSNTYYDWLLDHAFLLVPAQAYVAEMLQTLVEFPRTTEAVQLQPRPGDGQAAGRGHRRQLLTPGVARSAPGSTANLSQQGLGMRVENRPIELQGVPGAGNAQIRALPGVDEVAIDVRGLPPNRAFTASAARGNDTVALLTATSNNTGVIPEALAFVAFFANNYDKVILRPT